MPANFKANALPCAGYNRYFVMESFAVHVWLLHANFLVVRKTTAETFSNIHVTQNTEVIYFIKMISARRYAYCILKKITCRFKNLKNTTRTALFQNPIHHHYTNTKKNVL